MAACQDKNFVLRLGTQQTYCLRYANNFTARLLGWRARGKCDGVWLIPCSAIQTFTVKQSFDLIWLDKDKNVVRLDFRVQRNRILSCLRAHSVIELSAGALVNLPAQINLLRQGKVQ